MAQQNDSQRPGTDTSTSTQPQGSQQPDFDTRTALVDQARSLQTQIAADQQAIAYTGTDKTMLQKKFDAQDRWDKENSDYRQVLNNLSYLEGSRSTTTNVNAPSDQPNIVTRDQNGNLKPQQNPNYNPTMAQIDQAIKLSQAKDAELNAQYAAGKLSLDQWQAQMNANHQAFQDQIDSQLNAIRANDSLNQANANQLGAETSRFDRLFTTAGDIADAAVRGPMLPAILQNTASKGALDNLQMMNSRIASGNFGPVQFKPTAYNLPFDPTNIGTQIAVSALQHLSPVAQQLNSSGAFQPAPTGINIARSAGDITKNAAPVPYTPGAAPTAQQPSTGSPAPSYSFTPGSPTDYTPGNPMGNRID